MRAVMEAVAEPDLWPDALDMLAHFFGGVAAMAEFHGLGGEAIVLGPRSRFLSERTIARYLDHYARFCPRPRAMVQPRLPPVQTDRLLGDPKALEGNPFYSELLAGDGLGDYLGLRLQLRRGGADVLAVHRLRADGHASDEEIAWMYELAPFLRSAFRARSLLGEAALGADGLVGRLAALAAPVAFLAADGHVLFENDAARQVLAREPAVSWPELLRRWQAAAGGAEDSGAVTLSPPAGSWRVRILDLSRVAGAGQPGAGVYVAVLEPVAAAADVAGRLGLTTTEADVLRMLVAGRRPAEIARERGVSLATVRTHVARLREKFGVSRTLDVVRLALAGAEPP